MTTKISRDAGSTAISISGFELVPLRAVRSIVTMGSALVTINCPKYFGQVPKKNYAL